MKRNSTPPEPSQRSRPRRGLRRVAAVLASLAAVFVLASVIAPFFIPWDKVKDEIVTAGSKALGRELSIGRIDVSLFSGVHIRDIQVANAGRGFSKQPLFSNSDAKVNLSLLSLFTGKLVINSVTFVHPSLLIETDAQGRSNVGGLGGASSVTAAQKSGSPAAHVSAKTGGFPAILLSFVIRDGDLVLKNRQKGTETDVKGLNVKLQGLSLAAAGASRLQVDLVLEEQGKKIPISLVSDFRLDLAGQSVDIGNLELTAPALDATLRGTVKDFKAPAVDFQVAATIALEQLPALLPPSALAGLPPGLKTQGALKLDLKVAGALARPRGMALSGGLAFDKVGAVYGAYPAVTDMQGTLSFDRGGVRLPDLAFKLGGDPAAFSFSALWGDLANILGPVSGLKATVRYALSSPRLNLDPILAAGSGATTTAASLEPSSNSGGSRLPDYSKSVPRGLLVNGSIDAGSLVVKGFTTGKLTQRLSLRNRRVTSSTDLFMYQGRVYERSKADFSRPGPVFSSHFGVSGLVFHKLVDDALAASPGSLLARLKGKVDGVLNINAQVQGRGFDKPFVLDNTRAKVDFSLQDAVVRKTDLQGRLAGVVPYPAVQQFLRSDIKFSNALGKATYAMRRVTLKGFWLGSGGDWRQGGLYVQASGFADVGGALDFKIVPHFNPSLGLIQGDLGRAFQDEKGWPTFDYIKYSGPSSDKAKADFSAALRKAAGNALNQHLKSITHALGQKAGGLLKQLPGGLNRLFGQ